LREVIYKKIVYALRHKKIPMKFLIRIISLFIICENVWCSHMNGMLQPMTIHQAVAAGNFTIVKELLAHGVSVDERDEHKNTPLHIAALQKDLFDIVVYLLSQHADINAENENGHTPLHLAFRFAEVRVIRVLLTAHSGLII
jgi:ankyrin repeat protein